MKCDGSDSIKKLWSFISIVVISCSAWYPNLNKSQKAKLQTLQNKCIRFCMNLNDRACIGLNDLRESTSLPSMTVSNKVSVQQLFNFFNNKSPSHVNDVSNVRVDKEL